MSDKNKNKFHNEEKESKVNTEETEALEESVKAEENTVKDEPVEEVEVVKKAEFDKIKAESADYKDRWVRSVAEFDNYKKRNANVWQDAFYEGKKEVVSKILSIGDNLETAIGMIPDDKSREGVEKLLKQFVSSLESIGVKPIDPTGEEFDPAKAEAVMQVDAESEEEKSGFIKATFRKGYEMNGKIIRYAQVSVIR